MRDLNQTVEAVFAAIDQANALDPNNLDPTDTHPGGPLALVQGQRGTVWVDQLAPDASPELRVAARAHHLRRWELARADFPEGRAGYLAWRRANKAHQAASLAAILTDVDCGEDSIARAEQLLGRTKLRSDPETQTLEDVACLVFLETQFEAMVERTEHDHMVTIVTKTLRKMSPSAIDAAGGLELSSQGQKVVGEAVAQLTGDDA